MLSFLYLPLMSRQQACTNVGSDAWSNRPDSRCHGCQSYLSFVRSLSRSFCLGPAHAGLMYASCRYFQRILLPEPGTNKHLGLKLFSFCLISHGCECDVHGKLSHTVAPNGISRQSLFSPFSIEDAAKGSFSFNTFFLRRSEVPLHQAIAVASFSSSPGAR